MIRISAVIITLNEEKKIEQCIRSLQRVADEIVIVDSYSTDQTENICKKLGVRFIQNTFAGYRDQKNFATKQANFDIILSLDADEALSVELEQSILKVKDNWTFDAYKFNRLNNYCGQWIYHSNWYPDSKIRLFDRRKGEWGGLNIHETVKMHPGVTVGTLNGDLLHWSLSSYEEHIDKANRFSTISAQEYFKLGRKSSIFKIFFNSGWRFFKAYIIKLGFLDGYNGFVISSFSAYTSFLKYLKLHQLHLNERQKKGSGSKPNNKSTIVAS